MKKIGKKTCYKKLNPTVEGEHIGLSLLSMYIVLLCRNSILLSLAYPVDSLGSYGLLWYSARLSY